jgi:site-specific recombinase XerD
MEGQYYPEYLLPVVGQMPVADARFAQLREKILLAYGRNTARAYWGDLDDVFWWARQRSKDILSLSEKDIRQYVALLRRRKYSENTIRRRVTTLRKLYDAILEDGLVEFNPASAIFVSRPRSHADDHS